MPPSSAPQASQQPERGRVTIAGTLYEVARDFGRTPPGLGPARVSQVAVDGRGRVHVLRRGAAIPVLVFSPEGDFLYDYGKGHIFDAHGITIDGRDRVFIVDRDAHQVLCFDPDGTFRFALGDRHQPHWEAPFNHPTQAASAADGEIYVADGYGNGRVHRFSADGRHLASFGTIGHGPGAFMTPHALLIDGEDRVLVCDRENDRVQLFDRKGGWLGAWDGLCRPMDLCALSDGTILVSDQVPSLTAFAPDGSRLGRARPSLNGAHGIAADAKGPIYLAEIDPTAVTKLTPLREATIA